MPKHEYDENLHRESVKKLSERYRMSVMSHTPDYQFVNMVSGCGYVSCVIKNNTFSMGFNQSYGTFNYSPLHVSHIGAASDLAFGRCLRLSHAAKASDIKHDDTFDSGVGSRPSNVSETGEVDVQAIYNDLSNRIRAIHETINSKDAMTPEGLKEALYGIPLFSKQTLPEICLGERASVQKMYRRATTCVGMLIEELDAGLSIEGAKRPLAKMNAAILKEVRMSPKHLFDELKEADYIGNNEFTIGDSQHEELESEAPSVTWI